MIPYSVVAMQEDPTETSKFWQWAGQDALSAYRISLIPKPSSVNVYTLWQPPKLEGGK